MKENEIDEHSYPYEEVFDVDTNNECLRDEFLDIRIAYECNDTLDGLLS